MGGYFGRVRNEGNEANEPDVWEHPELITALAAGDFSALLRGFRKWSGLSQTALGARCALAQSDVSAIEHGRRVVTSASVQQRILDGLGVPPGLRPLPPGALAVPTLAGAPDEDTADRLGAAVAGDRLDRDVLAYLAATLAEHRRIEDRLGARTLLPVVTAQADVLTRLTRYASGALHDEALSLSAQYAQFLAWMRHDQRDDVTALRLFADAETQAQEAGDPTMAAHVLSMKGHLAWGAGKPLATVRYAQAAQWAGSKVTPGGLGMASAMEARGLAVLRDADGADRATDRAEHLLAQAAEHWEDEPRWLYFYGGVWIKLQVGALQLDLGRARAAAETLGQALDDLDPGYVRDGAWYRSIRARALGAAGDPEAAATEALAVLPDALATNGYALDHLRETSAALSRRAGTAEPVRALAERLQAVA